MRRIRLSYILPAILVFIGATIFVRAASLFQDMNHLVAGRKPHDAEIITRMVSAISSPQVTDRDQQLVVMGRKLQSTHRSTRVLISDKVGTYLIDNSKTLNPGAVPNNIVKIILQQWKESNSQIFNSGAEFRHHNKSFYVIGKAFSINVDGGIEQRFVILITNLDDSIKKYYPQSVANLIAAGLLISVAVSLAMLSVISPLHRMVAAVSKSKRVMIARWWPEEIARLANQYNGLLDSQEKANDELRETIDLSNKVINGIPDCLIFVKGHDRRYLLANQEMIDLVGHPILGLTDYDIWPDYALEYNRNDDEAISNGSQINKLEAIDKNGKQAWLSSSKIAIEAKGKKAVLGVCIDVTQLVEALAKAEALAESEKEIREEFEKLQQSWRHDLLSAVLGVHNMFEVLENIGFKVEDSKFKEPYEIARAKASFAYKLVRDTKDLNAAMEEMVKEPTTLRSLMDSIKLLFPEANITYSLMDEDCQILMSECNLVGRAISNIINNAIKFSGLNGIIEVGIRTKDESAIIYVKDNGIGMDEEGQKKIFSGFGTGVRLRQDIRGDGFGLHSALNIVKAHDGSLTVKSKLGQGSVFFLKIPLMP
jgi:PAS domain-containing protein